jgi:tmRNA-binding protein
MADKGALLAENRKARFQYTVESTLECGIVLTGDRG